MFKKIICLGVLAVMSVGLFCGCKQVGMTPTLTQTEGDFVLNISVSSDTFKRGQNIEVEMVFENLSGADHAITHSTPMILPFTIKNKQYEEIRLLNAVQNTLVQGPNIETFLIGSLLKKGKYELVATALFSLDSDPDQNIRIISNTIFITVK